MRITPKPFLIFEASVLLCLVLAMLVSSCTIRRQGLLDPQMKFIVEPQLFCPGDPVTVSWDFTRLSRSPDNCRPSLLPCVSNVDCRDPASDDCVDRFCCPRTAHATGSENCPNAEGCPPAFNVSITADPPIALDPPVDSESTDLAGSRTVTPGMTTTFTMNADITPPPTLMTETRRARMVTRTPETNHVLEFLFQCAAGGRPGWRTINADSPRLASENVRIINVRNNTRHVIVVTGGEAGREVTLTRDASTPEFNGAVRGIWSARLSESDPARAIVPRCEGTGISNPWPDLRIELILECVAGG